MKNKNLLAWLVLPVGLFLLSFSSVLAVSGGSISGYKWLDLDTDGIWDREEPTLEPPINGWDINILGPISPVTTTDEGGFWFWDSLPDGDYVVCERASENWRQTFPTGGVAGTIPCPDGPTPAFGYQAVISEGSSLTDLNFGNIPRFGTIETYKFYDSDKDGQWDDGEPPIEGWEICAWPVKPADQFLASFWDFFFPDNQICLPTDSAGLARFQLPPGQYNVIESMREDGWFATVVSDYSVTLPPDGTVGPLYFGNKQPDLSVWKFWDKNENEDWDRERKREEGEPALAGWEFCLYYIDPETDQETPVDCRLTNEEGLARWNALVNGNYHVVESPRPDWYPTGNDEEWFEVQSEDVEPFFFGNSTNLIRSLKFWDKDADSWQDEDEPALGGWEICLYREGEEEPEAISCQRTDGENWLEWPNQEEGDYFLQEIPQIPQGGWRPTNSEGGFWQFSYDDRRYGGGTVEFKFGNTYPYLRVLKFFDQNQDGEWSWLDEEGGDGEDGEDEERELVIPNWQFCLYRNPEIGEEGQIMSEPLSCQRTGQDGWLEWLELDLESRWLLVEEERNGWRPTGWWRDNGWENPHWLWLELELGENRVYWGNWIDDPLPPESTFSDPLEHKVIETPRGTETRVTETIETEILSMNLSGGSVDLPLPPRPSAGVRSADLSIFQVADSELAGQYPAQSFFDVFTEISCPRPDSPDFPETVPTEMVSLELSGINSVNNPINWQHNWQPSEFGVYCAYVGATDNAGNVERTAIAGPIAIVPTPPPAPEPEPEPAPAPVVGGGGVVGSGPFAPQASTGGQVLGASISSPAPAGEVLGQSVSAPQVAGALCESRIAGLLGFGSRGEEVRRLQGFLNERLAAGLPLTGFYGPLTRSAVSNFQLKYWQDILAPWVQFGLPTAQTATGYFGKTSRWKANGFLCPSPTEPFPIIP